MRRNKLELQLLKDANGGTEVSVVIKNLVPSAILWMTVMIILMVDASAEGAIPKDTESSASILILKVDVLEGTDVNISTKSWR